MTVRTAVALAVVLPLAVGLPLYEQFRYYDRYRYREAVTTVPHGGAGRLNHASWRLLDIRRDGIHVRIRVSKTALDETGVTLVGTVFELRDGSGRSWDLEPDLNGDLGEPGRPVRTTIRGDVPATVTDRLVFVIRALPLRRAPRPVPVLRFPL